MFSTGMCHSVHLGGGGWGMDAPPGLHPWMHPLDAPPCCSIDAPPGCTPRCCSMDAPPRCTPPPWMHPLLQHGCTLRMQHGCTSHPTCRRHNVKRRSVRILLECILVILISCIANIILIKFSDKMDGLYLAR